MYIPATDIVSLSDQILTQWDIKFAEAINAQSKQFENFTTKITTKQLDVQIPFINSWEDLEEIELYGDPAYIDVKPEKISRTIARYSKGLYIGEYTYNDPVYQSMFWNQLGSLVAQASRRPVKAIMDALKNGDDATYTKALVYDDGATELPLFYNNHTLAGNTFDNLYSGALNATNLKAGILRFQTIPIGPNGEYLPMAGAKIYCIIPPQLEYDLDLLINSTTIYEANINATNPYKGIVEKIVDNYFANDGDDWYMMMTLPSLTPFVTVEHTISNPSLQPFIDKKDREVAEKHRFRWLLDLQEETYPVHYFQLLKFTNGS